MGRACCRSRFEADRWILSIVIPETLFFRGAKPDDPGFIHKPHLFPLGFKSYPAVKTRFLIYLARGCFEISR